MQESNTSQIMAVGLNPAWQKTLHFERVILGEVNRARRMKAMASGKGVNFANALKRLGYTGVVAQFAGGDTGQQLCADLERRGIAHLTCHTDALTRTCTTLLSDDAQPMTELIEPAAAVTQDDVLQIRKVIVARLMKTSAVALCGTTPPGVPGSFYADLIAKAREHEIPVLLDAYKDVTSALRAGPHIVKINVSELRSITHNDDVMVAAKAFFNLYPVSLLGVTAGADGAFLFTRRRAWSFKLPQLTRVLNALGAGDTANAALLGKLTETCRDLGGARNVESTLSKLSDQLPDIFAAALATASASCLTTAPAEFEPATASALRDQVTYIEILQP